MTPKTLLPSNYAQVLAGLKAQVRSAQFQAATAVNRELIALYMEIGRRLADQDRSWGKKVIERLAEDLRAAFPEMKGFSRSNLFYMRQVYSAWADADESVQQLVGQIPWGHHLALVSKIVEPDVRVWYLRQANQVLDECKGRLRFFKDKLGLMATQEHGLEHLRKVYEKYLPDVLKE